MTVGGVSMEGKDRTERFLACLGQHDVRLRGYILSLCPHWEDAQEIFQEVQLRLWQQFDEFDPGKDFGAWACTIAYFFVLALRKQQSRRRLVFSEPLLEKLAARSSELPEQTEARYAAMMVCLGRLDPSKRDMITRYYAGKEPGNQMAASLGRSFDSLRQIVLRTRRILARCVEATLRQEGLA